MKTLVIIHGWTYTIEPWTTVVQLLRDAGVKVEQLRVPGLTEKSQEVWTIESYVAWFKTQLAGRHDIAVLGHSNGGRIALHYLAEQPNGFRQLILLNAAGMYYPQESLSWKRRVARGVAKVGKPFARLPLVRRLFYRLIGSDYGRAPANMKQTLSNMLESDKRFDPSLVRADKIDLLWGRQDPVTPIGMGRLLHDALAGSHLHEYDEWRHAPYITHPEQVARAILEVLE